MTDFIIQFGQNAAPEKIKQSLQARPLLSDRPVHLRAYSWGKLAIQEPPGARHMPYEADDRFFGCVGRPRFIGHDLNAEAFCARLFDSWKDETDPKALLDSLTGLFALVSCSPEKISILRDHMGAQPLYKAEDSSGKLLAIGTDVEILANVVGCQRNYDLVSLGELLVYNSITFPFSSRHGITEFQPASLIQVTFDGLSPTIEERLFWIPEEPESPEKGLADELVDRMRAVGSDIAGSANKIGVTLSGGLDSRAVISVLPKEQVTAITYVTHENYETKTAQLVAQKYGCEHVFARRSDDFFSRVLIEHGQALLGTERRAMLHGLCIPESGLDEKFDVILGGQLSDTYLKDHYMPKSQRELFRPKGSKERLGVLLRNLLNIPQPVHLPGIGSNLGRYRLEKYLSASIRQQVQERRAKRLDDVRIIRPSTAEEWVRFWPTSRQDDLAHIIGNTKLFAFETLFLHRYISDFATKLLPQDRYAGRVAHQAFSELYGELAKIQDANTGLLPGVRPKTRSTALNITEKNANAKIWNNVTNSWFDLVALQQYSPEWQAKRDQLKSSLAMDVLDPLIDRSATDLIATYAEDLGPTFNQMFFQLAVTIDKTLTDE